jgi:photosystem II stability/assembly factor-like uncharacterized protein
MKPSPRTFAFLALALFACSDDATTSPPGGDASALPDTSPPVDAGPLPPNPCIEAGTCPLDTWVDVTPQGANKSEFGVGSVVVDPARPSDLYVGGYDDGVWRSTDYGGTWKRRDKTIDGEPGSIPSVAQGTAVAVAGTAPNATVWVIKGCACGQIYKSTDAGETWVTTGKGVPKGADLYSLVVDPNDSQHLLSGLHEADGIVESTDGGETWSVVGMGGTAGLPTGGVSWFPEFIATGDPKTQRTSWFAIAQNGGSASVTRDGGKTWSIPTGMQGVAHAHGNAQAFQRGGTFWVAAQQGIFSSTDGAKTFTKLRDGSYSAIWGSAAHLYAGWAWACGRPCEIGPDLVTSPPPGNAWVKMPAPAGLKTGPMRVAITTDGTHTIYVGSMWWAGLWRYVESK